MCMNQAAPIAPRAAGPQRKAGSKTAAVAADAAAKAQAAAANEAAKAHVCNCSLLTARFSRAVSH